MSVWARQYVQHSETIDIEGEADVPLDIVLDPSPVIRARIIAPDGEPLANAAVKFGMRYMHGSSGSGTTYGGAETDVRGYLTYTPDRLVRANLICMAKKVGCGVTPQVNLEPGKQIEVTVELKPIGSVHGIILDAETGKPIHGATVGCSKMEEGLEWGPGNPVVSNRSGRFLVPDLIPGNYQIYTRPKGYARTELAVFVPPGVQKEITLRAKRGAPEAARATIKLLVVAPDGQTRVPGATVRHGKTTDENGLCEWTAYVPGKNEFWVSAEGYVPAWVSLIVPEEGGVLQKRVVLSNRGGRVTGIARDGATQQPMPGACVGALAMWPPGADSEDRRQARDTGAGYLWHGEEPSNPFVAVADGEGRYELTELPEGRYTLAALGPGFSRPEYHREGVDVHLGETTSGIDVLADPDDIEVTLRCRVLGAEGTPLDRKRVTLLVTGESYRGHHGGETDADGRVESSLHGLRPYRVQLEVEGYLPAVRRVELPPGTYEADLDVALQPAPPEGPPVGQIVGRVLLPGGGTPAERIMVTATPATPEYKAEGPITRECVVETVADGSFVLDELWPGRYSVEVNPFRVSLGDTRARRPELKDLVPARWEPVEVGAYQSKGGLRVVLQEGGYVSGHVLDAQTGKPVKGAWVRSDEHFEWLRRTSPLYGRTRVDGRFRLGPLPPGDRELTARAGVPTKPMTGEVTVAVVSGEEQAADILIRPPE
jgi:5-hydroxyisourate hydrolase-like protein (transthyretin family)